jgi:hypothetical protein
MSTKQRHAAVKPEQKTIRNKRDLASDKDKPFHQKFDEFIRAHPSEAEGLAAYEALPD